MILHIIRAKGNQEMILSFYLLWYNIFWNKERVEKIIFFVRKMMYILRKSLLENTNQIISNEIILIRGQSNNDKFLCNGRD